MGALEDNGMTGIKNTPPRPLRPASSSSRWLPVIPLDPDSGFRK